MNEHPRPDLQGSFYAAGAFAGSVADNYERYFVPAIGRPVAEDLIEDVRPQPGERVLDVGCGTGVLTRLAAARVGPSGTVAGLDVNPGMLQAARGITNEGATIDWYEANADSIPLPDDSFDLVLCQMALQFVTNRPAALREMRRVLAPGGRLVVNVPGPTPPLFAAMAEALRAHIAPEPAGFTLKVFSLHETDEIRGLLEDAGFRNIGIATRDKRLVVPAPADFLWQYIHSTPMAPMVLAAPEERREALEQEVASRWQPFVADGGMAFEARVTTATAEK